MDLNLKNKVVAVTGGSQGIGKAIVLEFLKEGCKVAAMARRREPLDALREECEAKGFGADLLTLSTDATDPDAMAASCASLVERFGKLDIWVNNAGKSYRKALLDCGDDEWNECLDLNLSSVFRCCKLAAREMRKTGGGVIVNTLSFSIRVPVAGNGPYAVAKRGLQALTEVLAAELVTENIRVVGFTPGFIETPLTADRLKTEREYYARQCPMNRVGVPEDLAPAVVFLSSDLAGYITGTDLVIAGGKFCVQNPLYAWDKR